METRKVAGRLKTHTPSEDLARHESGNKTVQTRQRVSKTTARNPPKDDFVLLVRPKRVGEHAEAASDKMIKLVASKIDPIQSRIALRGTRHISGGRIAFLTITAVDLARLEEQMEAT